MVAHHGDQVVQLHDLAHAGDRLGLAVVHAGDLPPHHRARGQGGDLEARQPDVDAVLRRSVHLLRGVEPLGRRADQLEVLRILELHVGGDRQLGRGIGQLAVAQFFAGVRYGSIFRLARGRIDVPALGRGGDQHGARGGAGLPERRVERPHRAGRAGDLEAEQRVGVELVVGRGVRGLHLIPGDLELFGH